MKRFNKLFRPFNSQVEFLGLSTVVAVQTRGRESLSYYRWVTLFRLELSQDCVTFRPLLDGVGSNVVNIAFYHRSCATTLIRNQYTQSNYVYL